MGPKEKWIEDWMVGKIPDRELKTGTYLLQVFSDFWNVEELDQRSETSQRRYSGSLHALGGYLVGQVVSEHHERRAIRELLWEAVDLDEGPLLFHDNEGWQRELDTTCRGLHGYLKAKG